MDFFIWVRMSQVVYQKSASCGAWKGLKSLWWVGGGWCWLNVNLVFRFGPNIRLKA